MVHASMQGLDIHFYLRTTHGYERIIKTSIKSVSMITNKRYAQNIGPVMQ